MSENNAIVPFGKYKDQPVELLLADDQYLNWVMSQPGLVTMLQKRHPTIYNIIVTGAPTTEDTPEHNRLQAMFLEKDFQLAFIEAATGQNVQKTIQQGVAKLNEDATKLAGETVALAQSDANIASAKLKEKEKEYEEKSTKQDLWKEYGAYSEQRLSWQQYLKAWEREMPLDYETWLSSKDSGGWEYHLDTLRKEMQSLRKRSNEDAQALEHWQNFKPSLVIAREPHIKVTFECGYDVQLSAWSFYEIKLWKYKASGFNYDEWCGYRARKFLEMTIDYNYGMRAQIELKPQMGDDFPSVLRQMKNNEADTLVIGSFNAAGAKLEQVRLIFGNKKIITLAEIENKKGKTTMENTIQAPDPEPEPEPPPPPNDD